MADSLLSDAFQAFVTSAPAHAGAWMEMARGMDQASQLDKKTQALAYIAVLAAARLESGLPFHVRQAVQLGASREEIISAVLVGLPAVGNGVLAALPVALRACDGDRA